MPYLRNFLPPRQSSKKLKNFRVLVLSPWPWTWDLRTPKTQTRESPDPLDSSLHFWISKCSRGAFLLCLSQKENISFCLYYTDSPPRFHLQESYGRNHFISVRGNIFEERNKSNFSSSGNTHDNFQTIYIFINLHIFQLFRQTGVRGGSNQSENVSFHISHLAQFQTDFLRQKITENDSLESLNWMFQTVSNCKNSNQGSIQIQSTTNPHVKGNDSLVSYMICIKFHNSESYVLAIGDSKAFVEC